MNDTTSNTMMILILIAICGAFIYFLYFPFRLLLLKSGRLNKRLDKRINIAYLLILALSGICMCCLSTTRTYSSRENVEKNAYIKLPATYTVIKDEDIDMFQDYSISYHIRFEASATRKLAQEIRKSAHYNPNVNSDEMLHDSLYFHKGEEQLIWCKSPKGYRFNKNVRTTVYFIDFDTTTHILKYDETMF